MTELKKLEKIKGIGNATIDKLQQNGIEVIDDLSNLDREDLQHIGLTEPQSKKIVEFVQNNAVQATIPAEEMKKAEQNYNLTRASQEHYDAYKKTQIRQYNKLPCPNCSSHMILNGAVFFGDLASDEIYVQTKSYCSGPGACLESRHLWKMKKMSQEEIDKLPYTPVVE